jgi:hypothetical protein
VNVDKHIIIFPKTWANMDYEHKEKSATDQSNEKKISPKGRLQYLDGCILRSHPLLVCSSFY